MQISIITATYNAQEFIAGALDSYINQNYSDKELIVVDGKSTDSTLEILSEYKPQIHKFVSERDKGIYDALNKGINLATGDIIGILHSDDFFANEKVLEKVAKKFENNPTVQAVYGDLQYIDRKDPNKIIRNWNSGEYNRTNLEKGWMPPHPALFIKKECFNQCGNYNLIFKSAADYDLILRFLYKHQINTTYLPEVLVKMRVGGLSNKTMQNRIRANKEDRLALKINGIPNPTLVSFWKPISKIAQFWNKNI